MPSSVVQLGIRDQTVKISDHIAYFWETEEEFEAGVGFLEAGLRAKDHCVVFGHPEANTRILKILAASGIDVPLAIAAGQLSVLGGKRVSDEMLGEIAATFDKAIAAGVGLIRLLGNIGWGHPDWPVEQEILRFEAQVTDACRKYPTVVVCMYDVRTLSGRVVVRGGMQTHPLTMCGGGVEENPYFVPSGQYIARYCNPKN